MAVEGLRSRDGAAATPFTKFPYTWGVGKLTGQILENYILKLDLTTDSTFVSGTNLTWTSAYGSSPFKLNTTWTGTTGGVTNLYSLLDASTNLATANDGAINVKAVIKSADTAVTAGFLYGGQFIAKKSGSGIAAAEASFIGCEGWFYETGTGEVRTGIGGNFGYHADSSVTHAGGVWRGIQVFCDNLTNRAAEATGICIWNMGGAQDHVFNIVNSANGFTNFALFTDDGAPAISTCSSVSAIGTKGYIKVKVGSATRYIGLSETAT